MKTESLVYIDDENLYCLEIELTEGVSSALLRFNRIETLIAYIQANNIKVKYRTTNGTIVDDIIGEQWEQLLHQV